MLQKVFITKYALAGCIIEAEMEVKSESKSCYGKPNGFSFRTSFFGNDFHLTKEEAIKDAEKRREKKIASLKKQIENLEKKMFEV